MDRVPITFVEKVSARYVRRGIGACWMWEGSLHNGRPAINLRYVNRFIYEQEFGPIPAGLTLWRLDHEPVCKDTNFQCRHILCVNPYHQRLLASTNGLYRREREWDGTTTDHTLHYLRQQRAKRALSGRKNDGSDRDQEGFNAPDDDPPVEGLRMEEPNLGEPRSPRDS